MRILFIEVDTAREWACASIGPAFMAAFLRARDHEVSLYRASVEATPEEVVAHIRENKPDLLGAHPLTRS